MAAVTVGLPFRDARDSLADAIRSIFAQSFTDWELLLVDDGSTDGSLEIARRVRDPRVRVASDGKHRRLPARLNQIAAEARGELLARFDADDLMHPDRLARQVALLTERPALDLVGTACFAMDRAGEIIGIVASEPPRVNPWHVLRRGLLAHATLLCRRAWCRAHPYDERFPRAEDRELYCRTAGEVRFAHLGEPLYFIRYRKGAGAMRRDYVRTCRDNRRVFVRHAPRLVGPLGVVPLVAESFAKEAIFCGLSALGLQGRLLAARGRAVTEEEVDRAREALRRVQRTDVTGLDR
ncbi:MAG: glycosyltransferase family 2 protein [Myxococcales bacterium]|nr:glycosyltransferase family 2 protein [Myxococcales bacterium]